MEGHACERAFVKTSQLTVNRPTTVGVQHSALRLMDFRMFHDPRAYDQNDSDNDPLPDFTAVNGAGSRQHLIQADCPENRILKLEALRYEYLAGNFQKRLGSLPPTGRTLIAALDYLAEESRFQIKTLLKALQQSSGALYSRVIIKPHPYSALDKILGDIELPAHVSIETSKPLKDLWSSAHVIYCSNITSAAIEAAWLGFPVISLRSYDDLNLSPFFGSQQYPFPKNAEELNEFLIHPPYPKISADYFYTDSKLPRWRKLFANTIGNSSIKGTL